MGVGSGGKGGRVLPLLPDFQAWYKYSRWRLKSAIFRPFFAIFRSFFSLGPPWKRQIVLFFGVFANFWSFFRCPPLENFLPTPLTAISDMWAAWAAAIRLCNKNCFKNPHDTLTNYFLKGTITTQGRRQKYFQGRGPTQKTEN